MEVFLLEKDYTIHRVPLELRLKRTTAELNGNRGTENRIDMESLGASFRPEGSRRE